MLMNGKSRWFVIVAFVCVMAACGSSSKSATPTTPNAAATVYVGKVTGTNAYVAVAAGANGVVAYVCDGAKLVAYLSGKQVGANLSADEPAQLVSVSGTR